MPFVSFELGKSSEILKDRTAPQIAQESFRNNLLISNLQILRRPDIRDPRLIVATSADLAPSGVWHRTLVPEAHRGIKLGHILGFYQSLSEGVVAWEGAGLTKT